MKKMISFLALLMVLMTVSIPAFAETSIEVEDPSYYEKFKGKGITINVYNWGEYIADGTDESLDTIKEFEEFSGINVNYTNFATNEEMYAKIKSGGAQYDVVIPSDYMVARMIKEGMLEELDMDNIPNIANVDPMYLGMGHDPEDRYSLPYMWGTVGIVFNRNMVDEEEITGFDILWDERYMGQILMFSNSRDAFGVACMRLGYSVNTTDEEELERAAQDLKDQKPLVQAYVQDEIYNKMLGGEAAVAPYYAGDALMMMWENEDLGFVHPQGTTNYFVDSFVIPKGSRQKEAAEAFINFMCEVEVSAANADYIGYSTPIPEALDLLEFSEEDMAIAYPGEEYLANTEVYIALPEETGKLIDSYWTEILSYDENQNKWVGPVFLALTFGASFVIMIVRWLRRKREAALTRPLR